MQFLILFLTVICFFAPPAFGGDDAGFDSFIKSREVVATLYFQANSEDLSKGELERISDTISQLRKLQKSGRMIRVEGFSSSEGDKEVNFRLSFFRARTVADLIETKGLPAEVTLTGYGDLHARSDDPNKERRVEIASYIKPAGIKRIKVADNKTPISPDLGAVQSPAKDNGIDSYRVDQAIRSKLDNRNKGLADQDETIDGKSFPGLTQADIKVDYADELDRGYGQWRKSVDPNYSPKVSQATKTLDSDLKRGYSQSRKAADSDLPRDYSQLEKNAGLETSPGVTQVMPAKAPYIDALMIEQIIMEKIGAETPPPSGAVSQLSAAY